MMKQESVVTVNSGPTPRPSNMLKPWTFEIVSFTISIATLIAMVAILASYNGKAIFDGRVITLNAIISTLSTASKATLLTVIASCISQGNWILFADRPRRLYDFEMIADASRGPLGSLKVLWSRSLGGGVLVRIGAVATILTLALDPFTQQLIQLDTVFQLVEDAAAFPYAMRYSKGIEQNAGITGVLARNGRVQLSSDSLAIFADADFAMQSAVTFGLAASSKAIEQQATFQCPAADCDFEPVSSLAVCSKCSDVTSKLEKNEKSNGAQFSSLKADQSSGRASPGNTEYTLPNGLILNNMNNDSAIGEDMLYMTMLGTSNVSQTVAMNDLDTLIWAQSIIRVDADPDSNTTTAWPDFDVNASECALYYCVRKYNATSRGGLMHLSSEIQEDERRREDSWQFIALPNIAANVTKQVAESVAYHPFDSIIARSDLQLGHEGSDEAWNITQIAVDGISSNMQNVFATCRNGKNCTLAFALEKWDSPNGFYLRQGKVAQYKPSAAKVLFESKDFAQTFENIAASMSNALRDGADDSPRTKGDKLVLTTVYKVVWPWIILHLITELGGFLLLVGTIWETAKSKGHVPVWKSSELAVFSRGFLVGDVFKGVKTMDELKQRSLQTPMVLVENQRFDETEGFPLVDRDGTPPGGGARDGLIR